jgi:hypothetical protein
VLTQGATQGPLPDLSAWQGLISHRPPPAVQQRVLNKDFTMQFLEDATGAEISLDYYAVRVTQLPTFGGATLTPEQLLEWIRKHLNNVVDTTISEFEPYDADEVPIWESATPEGAIVHIDTYCPPLFDAGLDVVDKLPADDLAVATSDSAADNWIFVTIWTPGDFTHPLGGVRQFGFTREADGSYIFYTRGADRLWYVLDRLFSGSVYEGQAGLWRSLVAGIARVVNSEGGAAEVLPAVTVNARYDWERVKATYFKPSRPKVR